jgi:pimeloyl-ACP methyl ester carboxylesterase
MQVRDELILLNRIRFHFREWGDPAAKPLVLLHGFTGHARSWDTFAAAMSGTHRVLALDQRGHGESGWADDYSTEAMVGDVAAFVDALGLRQFALLGLSMGGRNAYTYAATQPSELERLVIVDIGPELVASGAARIQAGVAAADAFESPEQAFALARKANPLANAAEQRSRTRNNLMLTADGRWTWRYDEALRDPNRPRPRPAADAGWALMPRINVATLLVRGERSDILSVDGAQRMVREIPRCAFVEVPDAGHSIPLDNPAGFIASVQPFLDS